MRKTLAFLLLSFVVIASTGAQTPIADVKNPSAVEFTPSTDHANVQSYELHILRPDGSVLQTLNIGKPTPNASNVATAPVNVQPIAFGAGYSMCLQAVAGTSRSDCTPSLNKFDRAPGAPSKLVAK